MENNIPTYRVVSASRGWDWIVEGFDLFKANPGIWIAITVIWALISLLGLVIGLGALVVPALTPILLGGLMIGCALLKRGEDLELAHLFAGFQPPAFVPLLLTGVAILVAETILSVLMVILLVAFGAGALLSGLWAGQMNEAAAWATGAGTFGLGVLLATLIGLVFTGVLCLILTTAPGLVALGGVQPLPAIRVAFKAGLANWLPMTVLGVVTIALLVVATIPAMLGLLVVLPILVGANYAAYRDIFPELPEQLPKD